jgi:cytosine/adenosine deaminase-related metal-dependent hydrolase
MVLNNVVLIDSTEPVNVKIIGNKITDVMNIEDADELQLTFNDANLFPGLTNSHDHLDFNLFPQLGDNIYKNYTEWGAHIHLHYKDEIAKVLKVPILLREQWGVLKNMVCGVTTVVNHGEKINITNPLITVHENYYYLHSVGFEKRWKAKLNNPLKVKLPMVVHIGEGTDQAAYNEIDKLISWNHLRKTLIGVHAVAMDAKQVDKFKAIVWCPQSNYFLLGETAKLKQLKKHTTMLFGSDSTLTGNWDIWDHISLARKTGMLTDKELYDSLQANASTIWKTNSNKIKVGNGADLFITKKESNKHGLDAFFITKPKDILLVIHQGNIRLFDACLVEQLAKTDLTKFSKINIGGSNKYVKGDVPALMNSIKEYYPEVTFPFDIN